MQVVHQILFCSLSDLPYTFYMQLLDKGTYWVCSERLKQFAKSFTLLPKKANIVGLQVADLVAYPITRHILDPNEPNMAYDVIRNNIYTENLKQIGIKIIPHEQKKDCQNWQSFQPGTPQSIFHNWNVRCKGTTKKRTDQIFWQKSANFI